MVADRLSTYRYVYRYVATYLVEAHVCARARAPTYLEKRDKFVFFDYFLRMFFVDLSRLTEEILCVLFILNNIFKSIVVHKRDTIKGRTIF